MRLVIFKINDSIKYQQIPNQSTEGTEAKAGINVYIQCTSFIYSDINIYIMLRLHVITIYI